MLSRSRWMRRPLLSATGEHQCRTTIVRVRGREINIFNVFSASRSRANHRPRPSTRGRRSSKPTIWRCELRRTVTPEVGTSRFSQWIVEQLFFMYVCEGSMETQNLQVHVSAHTHARCKRSFRSVRGIGMFFFFASLKGLKNVGWRWTGEWGVLYVWII